MSQRSELAKLSKACSYCRKKKVKCDGSMPCGNCNDRNKQCIYLPKSSRRHRHNDRRMPSPESRKNSTASTAHFHIDEFHSDACYGGDTGNITVGGTVMSPVGVFSLPETRRPRGQRPEPDDARSAEPIPSADFLTPKPSEVDREEATIDLKNINWEHHGPGSWLSVCSEPGIRWISVVTKTSGFSNVARGLIVDWTKHLTLAQYPLRERGPEIDFETAWKYATAYFEYSHDSVFGVVYRPEFEERLRRYFRSPNPQDEDAASYAMRHAVYAVGCRAAALADGAKDFMEAQQASLQFFFNAFSVYTHLIYMPTGLRAVQALIVMTSYAELLGSPSVEYMLCAAAVRLAQSKGLHRQPAKAWGLPKVEALHRTWTFWAVYCYDKYLALRSGRPSTLEEDDISCAIPDTVPAGSTMDIAIFTASIKHAQICSQMIKRLFSAKALDQSPESLLQQLEIIEHKLSEWKALLPDHLPLDADAFAHFKGSYRVKANIVRLQRAYYGSIIALHANFHYPWICSGILSVDANKAPFREPVRRSSSRTAEAARQILACLKHGVPDLGSSSTAAFYYPMLAIINLFIYILKYPSLPTALSDLAFLDIGSGHFGNILQLTSSHVSFRFPREAVGLADKVTRRANADTPGPTAEPSYANSPAGNPDDLSVDQFLDLDISPEQWSAMSAEFFDNFSAAGDMIVL